MQETCSIYPHNENNFKQKITKCWEKGFTIQTVTTKGLILNFFISSAFPEFLLSGKHVPKENLNVYSRNREYPMDVLDDLNYTFIYKTEMVVSGEC